MPCYVIFCFSIWWPLCSALSVLLAGSVGRFPRTPRQSREKRNVSPERVVLRCHHSSRSVLGCSWLVDDEDVRHWLAVVRHCCSVPCHGSGRSAVADCVINIHITHLQTEQNIVKILGVRNKYSNLNIIIIIINGSFVVEADEEWIASYCNKILFLTLWHPLLLYGYSYKASCARPG